MTCQQEKDNPTPLKDGGEMRVTCKKELIYRCSSSLADKVELRDPLQ